MQMIFPLGHFLFQGSALGHCQALFRSFKLYFEFIYRNFVFFVFFSAFKVQKTNFVSIQEENLKKRPLSFKHFIDFNVSMIRHLRTVFSQLPVS